MHVQAWRRALEDPAAERIVPHLTLAPPQTVAERDLDRAVGLVERVAADAVPFLVELDGAASFLPASPVAYLVALVVAAGLLWAFGEIPAIDGASLAKSVVLAFPASLGAALGRILV